MVSVRVIYDLVMFGPSRDRSDGDETWVWRRWLRSVHRDGVSLRQEPEEMRVSLTLFPVYFFATS